ncbi:BcSTC6, similar to sesquiterpene cyclase [Botrytis cinerea T4]|uniref:BcSTC6, similar to sesquiterpene cyclase n=1 Tax=Botryotinia fuckeliana (strain T4) TaxID=999810 RepID=G2YJ78_BOTF4|nr:BcSTC6, similar to sesquiterpene cyclase [Botrytis cinerea T4]
MPGYRYKRSFRLFSRYPAALSVGATDVERALSAIAQQSSQPDSREKRRALIRHSNAHGDPFAICHCSVEIERLVLLPSIIEDVTEELDHAAACREHIALAEVLKIDVQPSDFTSKNLRQRELATSLRKAIDLDLEKAPKMIENLQHYLATFDNRDDDFDRMEEYMRYRVANCGYWQDIIFIRWGMGITLSQDDHESIRQYDFTMGNILGLTNDYFSWNVEKNQTTDRIRNAVRVLIKQHDISPDAAKSLLLGLIVEEESKSAELKKERLKRPISHGLSMYFEAIELYVGGSCFWHATAPRYRVFE